ncbi:MAG TPA: nuclease [Comamonadaceae bacterium]|nr:nuclease [Comamonadaceae bacterium]
MHYSAGLRFLPAPVPSASLLCLVIAIHDGDTLSIRCGAPGHYRLERVRLAAIDAPEHRQAFGQRARQNLARLCFRQQARITPVDRDRYGRTVADVHCQGESAAHAQLRAGLAWVYTPAAHEHPQLLALQRQARASSTGLWSQARPLAPWDYRRRYQYR